MGNIEAVFQANKDTGLVVLTVDAGDALATVTLYNTNHELTVPVLLDPNSVFKTAYNIDINTIPLHFFIDSSGKIKAIVKGKCPWSICNLVWLHCCRPLQPPPPLRRQDPIQFRRRAAEDNTHIFF